MRTSFGWVGRGKYGSFLLVIDKAMSRAWLGLGYVAYLSIKCRRPGVRGHSVQTHQSKDPESPTTYYCVSYSESVSDSLWTMLMNSEQVCTMHIKAVLRPTNRAQKVIVLITAKTQKPFLIRPTCLPYASMYRSTQGCVCVSSWEM